MSGSIQYAAMNIVFRVHIDDSSIGRERRFARDEDVRYPAVPREGEYVVLPTNRPDVTLQARQVTRVIYTPDGKVILEIRVDGLTNDVTSQVETLRGAGYRELNPS